MRSTTNVSAVKTPAVQTDPRQWPGSS